MYKGGEPKLTNYGVVLNILGVSHLPMYALRCAVYCIADTSVGIEVRVNFIYFVNTLSAFCPNLNALSIINFYKKKEAVPNFDTASRIIKIFFA